MTLKVGFIGLGHMGFPIASNILKAGFSLSVYNRTKDKAEPLLKKGAHWAASPMELASQCDVVVSMVANDAALNEIVEGQSGIFRSSKKPAIHLSMSTVAPATSADLEKKHREKGIVFLAAPVSGRPERAKEATLWIFLAGDSAAKNKVAPILKVISGKTYDLGEYAAQASIFKLCSNFMILSFIESFAEAATLLEKSGISMEKTSEIWGSSFLNAPVFHNYTPLICKLDFEEGGFALSLGLKDMRLLQDSADRAQVPMPFLIELHEKLVASMNLGREKYDWSAITLITRESSGL